MHETSHENGYGRVRRLAGEHRLRSRLVGDAPVAGRRCDLELGRIYSSTGSTFLNRISSPVCDVSSATPSGP